MAGFDIEHSGPCDIPPPECCVDDADCEVEGEPGNVCVLGVCVEDAESQQGYCRVPYGECCSRDEQCSEDARCVCLESEEEGVCLDAVSNGLCWIHADCPLDSWCVGAEYCPCDSEQDCVDDGGPGRCMQIEGDCCALDEHCGEGELCAGQDHQGIYGSCVPALRDGECYVDEDCERGVCEGGQACNCLINCPSILGRRNPTPCCSSDGDCPAGLVCAGLDSQPDSEGVCREPAPGDDCWTDSECPDGMVCEGALSLWCGVHGPPERLGTCVRSNLPCCSSDDDCRAGQLCVGGDDGQGRCFYPAASELCWADGECSSGTVCWDARICPCGANCLLPDQQGVCLAELVDGCCWTSDQCGADQRCVGQRPPLEGGQCVSEPSRNRCWNEDDCADGLCGGVYLIPCDDRFEPEAGFCATVNGWCCLDDADCRTGDREGTCAGSHDGVPGTCMWLVTDPNCWSDEDCPAGSFCDGEAYCVCWLDCDMDERPGLCTELSVDCCTTDEDCGTSEDGPLVICVAATPWSPGRCMRDPEVDCSLEPNFQCCWSDEDCPSYELCVGGFVCGCGDECSGPDTLGVCVDFSR